RDAEIMENNIAISLCPPNTKNALLIAAKAADELLNLSGIIAAFVLCSVNNDVSISGRSLSDLNVQVILEKLGGGGHQTVAGAQLKDISVDEAKEKLKYAIIEYIDETDKNEQKD
ncbi:MAG TPA: phosphoesterase, partial [Clostridiaceae bacterium]|nr:phosphoesterase [Clostridiaceae bacterium]